MLHHIIDILFLIIAITTVIIFAKRGFIQSFFKYSKTLLAVIASYTFAPRLGDFLYERVVYNGIFGWVSEKVDSFVLSVTGKIDIDTILDEVPFIVRQFVSSEKVADKFGQSVNDVREIANEFSAFVSRPFSSLLSNLFAYILVFLLALLLLTIIGKLLDLITKIPVLHGINVFLGLLLGCGAAFLLLSALTYLLSILIGTFGNILYLEELSDSSYLFGFFDRLHLFDLL